MRWLALTIMNVSTVLRPVGPRDARVYWFRRAVVIAVIVAVIVVLVAVLSGGSSKPNAGQPPPNPTQSTSTPPSTQVLACNLTTLKLVLSTDKDVYTVGETPTLIGEFSNPSATACLLTTSAATESWTIKSGTALVWSTKGCTKAGPRKQLRIEAGGRRQVSIVWNGDRNGPNCAIAAVAQPGTYTLHASLDGVTAPAQAVFHITS
jgi:hypothetical protein